ncbi:hypothetical protein PLICRDRAFT_28185 [Plicaturopsis crispa FD-325 SS-3]|nr:hypothetical protein PLICRDRAFT_28185 [Plicaturopsis crispa FD-325 SS-3]
MPLFATTHTPSLELVRMRRITSPLFPIPYPMPAEREINRLVLLDIAPDREDLIMSGRHLDALREHLKIDVSRENVGHWLYQSKERGSVKLSDTSARYSAFMGLSQKAANSHWRKYRIMPGDENVPIIRTSGRKRSVSTSCVRPLSHSGLGNRPRADSHSWGELRLSTMDKLISPRPLGPTHILVLHSLPHSAPTHPSYAARRAIPGYCVEMPINDLLFALNVPHLANLRDAFPHRRPEVLTKVALRVSDVATFIPLVIFFHNRDVRELFSNVLPQWIVDLMDPLPTWSRAVTRLASPPVPRKTGFFKRRGSKDSSRSPSPTAPRSSSSSACSLLSLERTVDSIAHEIALVDVTHPELPSLVHALASLHALCDNLEDVGMYDEAVWAGLAMRNEILKKAVVEKSRMEAAVDADCRGGASA